MPDFHYARGRIADSLRFISEEAKEFNDDYAQRTWLDYQRDRKLQKLMDRTVENILTALIEVCGTFLAEEGISVESYGDALRKTAKVLEYSDAEQGELFKLANQRNRLAHRYLNFRWQAVQTYAEKKELVMRVIRDLLAREEMKRTEQE
jgi:uncharacterized protein YutE (UPF0331/DUF86 family)